MTSFKMADEISRNHAVLWVLIHKQMEKHGCILKTVATDALAISIHNAEQLCITFGHFC